MKNILLHFRNKPAVIATMIIFMAIAAHGQIHHTIYWMNGIPQSAYANPALQPNPNYYVGLPGLSAVYTGVANTGFAVFDVIKQKNDGSLYIDDLGLLNKLRAQNYVVFDLSNDWLAFGFRARKKNYFSFNISERFESRFGYSRDFFKLAIEGNDGFRQNATAAQLGGFGLDVNYFREFGIGYSRKWNDKLTLGMRGKFLQGMANINFERSDLQLFTEKDNYALLVEADMMVNTSLPLNLQPIDQLSDRENILLISDVSDMISFTTNTRNAGFAFDLGAAYDITQRFTLALSVRDLGLISWKSDVENFALTGNIDFQGLDIKNFIGQNGDDPDGEDDRMTLYLDSIINLFTVDETALAYSNPLNPKFYASAAFKLTPMHKFAVMARGELYKGNLYPSFTASYNFQPINRFGSTISYSIINGNYYNVGFGFHVNILPLQIYVVTDNMFWAMQPHTFQNFNIQLGVNIAGGFRKKNDLTRPRFVW